MHIINKDNLREEYCLTLISILVPKNIFKEKQPDFRDYVLFHCFIIYMSSIIKNKSERMHVYRILKLKSQRFPLISNV